MTPYFEQGNITLYHGDCRDILPTLAEDSVDVIVTDPPYGVNWRSARRSERFDAIAGDDSPDVAITGLRLAVPRLRRGRHVYVFGRFDLSVAKLAGPAELVWDKELFSGGDLEIPWGKQHEIISFYVNNKDGKLNAKPDGGLSARLRRGSVLRVKRPNSTGITHPTEKPVALLRQLIESSSTLGELVLDPFVGIGSTLVAALYEGRRAIGIEVEERYCAEAVRRLAEACSLFEALA